jgi:Carboxypeptidase regulatory-like domain
MPALTGRAAHVAAFIVLGVNIHPVGAQESVHPGVIDGLVTDSALAPLGDATVSFLGSAIRVVTGSNGRFRVRDMKPATYIVIVRRIGFEAASLSVQVASGDTVRPSFALQRATTRLDTVNVRAQQLTPAMQEFEARKKLGFGQFMTQKEIENHHVEGLQDLLATFNGVKMLPNQWPMSRRMDAIRPCPYEVYIDGVKLPRPSGSNIIGAGDSNIDNIVFPSELAGIEVYNGPAETPLQYKATSGGGFCGVILLWTRIGS